MTVHALVLTTPPLVEVFDFTQGVLPVGTTFTRAGAAWGVDNTLALAQYATDVPRFVYDPVTGANLGLLVEGSRINSIRNSTMVGAVAGTPGTAPTNWTMASTGLGITRTIVGTGTEDGIDYLDVRYFGTVTTAQTKIFYPEPTTGVAALQNQTWTASAYLRLVAGSLSQTSVTLFCVNQTAAGAQLTFGSSGALALTNAPLRTQRYSVTRTHPDATTAFTTLQVHIAGILNNTFDLTLRIGHLQLEQGDGPTSPIKTSTVAVTRATELPLITNPRILRDKCLVVRARAPNRIVTTTQEQTVIQVDDSTNNNRNAFYRAATTGQVRYYSMTSAIAQSMTGLANVANNIDFAAAARFEANNFAGSINGAAVITDVAGTVPAGLTTARVGQIVGSNYWNSTISRIETRTTASDAELIQFSAASVVSETELWMAAVTVNGGSVSLARKAIVEQFIAAEKAAGTWQLTDDYWPLWAENAPQALTSLKQRRLATAVAAPTFTVDRGYNGNGTTSYINSGFQHSVHQVAATGSNIRVAVYQRTEIAANVQAMGANEAATRGIWIRTRTSSPVDLMAGQVNTTSWNSTLPMTSSLGWSAVSRTAAPVMEFWKNGVSNGVVAPTTFTGTSVAQPIYILAQNAAGTANAFTTAQLGLVCIGASLTAPQELAQYTNVQAWATAIGANV